MSKKSQSKKDKSKTQEPSLDDKTINIHQQDKSILERIAAGGKVSPNLKKNSVPSNLIQIKSGSHAHGHILRPGDYRYSPGLQQIRLEYKEAQKVEKSKIQSSEKAANQSKDANLAEAIRKAAKTNESQSKSSSSSTENAKLSSEVKSTFSTKKTLKKQVAISKTTDENQKSKERKKNDEQHKSQRKSNRS